MSLLLQASSLPIVPFTSTTVELVLGEATGDLLSLCRTLDPVAARPPL
jgi:hypothetical protein